MALEGRQAIVSPVEKGAIVVWDEESNSQDEQIIQALGHHLSASLDTTVLAVMDQQNFCEGHW